MTDLIADKVITLDVGGHHFVTSLATLTKYPDTYFSGLFSGKYTLLKNGDAIFIDRDGTHFRLVLNFLRSGKIQMPTDTQERNELMLEAEFYCLREAIEASISHDAELLAITQCGWTTNTIFIGYKNIDFDTRDCPKGLKELLATVQCPDTTEHVWKSIHDPGLTVIFQIDTSANLSTDFSLKNLGPILETTSSWNRPHLRFVIVYDAELSRELLKLSGQKFSNSSFVWYFSKGELIECVLQWRIKYIAENIWKHYYLSVDLPKE